MHRLGLYLKNRDMIIAEYCEKIGHHELQAAHAEEEGRTPREEIWRQEQEFREVQQQDLMKQKELQNSRVLPSIRSPDRSSSRIRTRLWYYLADFRNYKMNQDAESVRSGNSHVTNQPMLFFKHPIPEGMLRLSFVSPRCKEGPPSIWDSPEKSGNVFCKFTCICTSSSSSRIESMENNH